MPSQWPVLGTANNSALTYGGFVGYNTQWEDVIVGFEANLNRAGFALNAPSTPIGPLTTAADSFGNTHTVTINANGSVTNFDLAGLRVRAGYVLGNFMPYAFGGAAFALSTVSIAATVHDVQCSTATPPVCNAFTFTGSNAFNNEVLYGFTIGGGVDVAVTPNVFLRAEFEWDQFKPPPGIMMSIATGRVGAGFEF
jgi:outer membrane immunogenic protein